MRDGKGEPENGDVKKYLSGIKDLFNLSFDRFNSKTSSERNNNKKCNCRSEYIISNDIDIFRY